MTETIVTDGVLRVTGEGVTIDGRPGNVAYLIPPCDVVIEGEITKIDQYGLLGDAL
jgi:hypothetical protein